MRVQIGIVSRYINSTLSSQSCNLHLTMLIVLNDVARGLEMHTAWAEIHLYCVATIGLCKRSLRSCAAVRSFVTVYRLW